MSSYFDWYLPTFNLLEEISHILQYHQDNDLKEENSTVVQQIIFKPVLYHQEHQTNKIKLIEDVNLGMLSWLKTAPQLMFM